MDENNVCEEREAARPDDIAGMEEMYNGGYGTVDMEDIYSQQNQQASEETMRDRISEHVTEDMEKKMEQNESSTFSGFDAGNSMDYFEDNNNFDGMN